MTSLKLAISNLCKAKLRTWLAIISLCIGTSSIVAMIGISHNTTEAAVATIRHLGTRLISISLNAKHSHQLPPNISKQTLNLIQQLVPEIQRKASYHSSYEFRHQLGGMQTLNIIHGTDSLAQILNWNLLRGRFLSPLDRRNSYCLLGSDTANMLAKTSAHIIGRLITFNNQWCQVIGILKPTAANHLTHIATNQSIILLNSYDNATHTQLPNNHALFLFKKPYHLLTARSHIKSAFHLLFPDTHIVIKTPQEMINLAKKQKHLFSTFLIIIALLGLVVGGVGISNMMLVSLHLRRHEIGIMLAVGATSRHIRHLFLLETFLIAVVGAIIGACLGWLIVAVHAWLHHWPISLYGISLLVGLVSCCTIGVLAGFFPARKASQLNPIIALRRTV